jgi:hypothetical protein
MYSATLARIAQYEGWDGARLNAIDRAAQSIARKNGCQRVLVSHLSAALRKEAA